MLLGIVLSIAATLTNAAPPSLSGGYQTLGDFRAVSVKHHVLVTPINQAERERLAELRAAGYTCEHRSSRHVVCSKFITSQPLEPQLAQRLRERGRGLRLDFEAVRSVELENDAPMLREWRLHQSVHLTHPTGSEQHFDELRFLELAELGKLVIGDYWINVREGELAWMPEALKISGRNEWRVIWVEYPLSRQH